MKYSIFGFNQEKVVALKTTKTIKGKEVEVKLDVSDLLILQAIADFMNRPKIQKILLDDKIYCWVKLSTILEDLPILNIKQQAFSDKIEKLVLFGLLEKQTVRSRIGSFSYYRIGSKYEELVYSSCNSSQLQEGTSSELHLRNSSELQDKDYSTNNTSTSNNNILGAEAQNKFNFKKSLIELGVSEQIVSDFLAVRKTKRAANTETAFNRIKSEIEKSGASANDCIKLAVERSWQGFKAEWYRNAYANSQSKQHPTRLNHPFTNFDNNKEYEQF